MDIPLLSASYYTGKRGNTPFFAMPCTVILPMDHSSQETVTEEEI
jgi:hypothetical protein